ncbi:OLC1v1014873C1 [Oldenlandia corymbosa var. corymbosa]|uniref:OLC1v1014873C1 n=1 Tax=Oldenlandia corymbosa var. corymbosa TaxID=529605 RepID=A0AAV1E5M7_OLDCO|nr:OLC1v1014873C1 [Oldenlandia corymbosa var. corymbosa]
MEIEKGTGAASRRQGSTRNWSFRASTSRRSWGVEDVFASLFGIRLAERAKITILKDASGIIKPSRMTLLLGPPSSGKTTLLLALAGKLDPSLTVKGEITYNGHRLNEFVPKKTSAYISQNDVHVGEMTVKETLDFSARCLGVGSRYELLAELARRERDAGILPEAEVDFFMKATAVEGAESSLITDYTLRILGLDVCRDTIVGDDMNRGISGGQKKRVTTGEMIVGPTKTLFMDEISTGLDSSTTYQIVKCLQQVAHLTEATILMSLLQPAPETFDLFDDIILLSEGQIVYQGPRDNVLEFFESCGFSCPERKGTADFLQEVTSKKDQEQYWSDRSRPYRYVPVSEFAMRYKNFHVGQQIESELSVPYDKARSHKAALVFKKYTVPMRELVKANFDKEWLLIKRNAFIYVFKTIQIIISALIAATVYLRVKMHTRNEDDGSLYVGALLFGMVVNMFNGFAELSLTIQRLPVFYKQRDLLFHPPWTFTLPTFLLRIPISIMESLAWVLVTYYTIGFAPEASRFFKHLLLCFLIQQMAAGLFRVIASTCRTMIIANTGGTLALLLIFLLGGFILPKGDIPDWWGWAYWISPLTYSFNALTVNELFAPRWMNKNATDPSKRLGIQVMENFDIHRDSNWFWIGAGALVGYTILTNIIFTIGLMYLDPLGKPQATISKEQAQEMKEGQREAREESGFRTNKSKKGEIAIQPYNRNANGNAISRNDSNIDTATGVAPKRGMVLPFTPLAMAFDDVKYYVDMPSEMRDQGVTEDRLQLLRGITGAFRPGVLTALMGVSGAGKTTLMDVLAGRKTGGYIEGSVTISGFPKVQETFARVSGYCEQTDIHSPQVTIHESLIFSAFLRLPAEVSKEEKMIFVKEVMELVELDDLKNALVGLPGVTGLSTEQRKRLTIAVELVANPSIIFMDEPTSGLDARAAAIVMRTVRNTVDTGRTVVCTIHQPSIDIFEAFDELLLMKRGGQVIYAGPLGRHSHKIVEYFESIPGVQKIKEKQNPAAWMLEASSIATEVRLGIDFAEHYKNSALFQRNKALVDELSTPPPGAKDLYFPSQFSQPSMGQFKYCFWKVWMTYWRSPDYNLVRYFFSLVAALMVGTIFWGVGTKRDNSNDLQKVIGALYAAVLFVGINNCSTVQPVVAIERTVFYREKAAGMYSSLPYALAQVVAEIPYILIQNTYYSLIVYAMVQFEWTAAKFFWFYFVNFFSFLYFTYYGMMTVSITPNHQVAAIFAAAFYGLFNLFSGFFIRRPRIPKWWIWYYWICPVAWTVYGLIVSQYGDVEDTFRVPGVRDPVRIKDYIRSQYGFRSDFMGPVAGALIAFTIFFAFIGTSTRPTAEVRFENLRVEADCHVGERAVPTLPNAALNIAESLLECFGIAFRSSAKRTKLTILKDACGVIKPSRMTLLLGPPSSGKTTLLLALAGRLDPKLKVRTAVSGDVTYNGHKLNEFVPQKTSAYVSHNDVHSGEMTVKETLEFSASCQGTRSELLAELASRTKVVEAFPDAKIDHLMKLDGEILGLDICQDTIVGDEMRRGISGGQKKRLTTGEILVGPTKTLFMDEISTGLDSSSTMQILKCLQQIVHLTEATVLMSLLQPAPEAFELFDDIILLSEGYIVYHGPRQLVLTFFESCGFKCPDRKGTADFLQEVTSRKDQEQYWMDRTQSYKYISAHEFSEKFKHHPIGKQLENGLSIPYDRAWSHKSALAFKKYSVPKMELLKANFAKELLLMKRNLFVYVSFGIQIILITLIVSTVFLKPRMHSRSEDDGVKYIGALIFCMAINVFNGFAELALTIQRLPVFYKLRDLHFHPSWAFTLPNFLLGLPISLFYSSLWMLVTYYGMGFSPEASRFFKQFLLVFLIQQMGYGLFRLIGSICRSMVLANTGGALVVLMMFLLGGFILPQDLISKGWSWAYWLSPLSYGFKALSVNEMTSPRWMNKLASDNVTRLGVAVLNEFDIPPDANWYWIDAAALLALGMSQAAMSKEQIKKMEAREHEIEEQMEPEKISNKIKSAQRNTSNAGDYNSRKSSHSEANASSITAGTAAEFTREDAPKKGMVLPFKPLTMSFKDVNYFVDMPDVMKEKGASSDRLQLLREVTGAFRPGILTALMGVSGAGKTTLLDVLSGRKTSGYIEGDIRIEGFSKKQETFARISGYCEQNDIHSPQITVHESLIFSAFLRLPKEISKEEKMIFVDEVMHLVELDMIKDAVVGLPGVTGLSRDQRKRLTIAVELVANPSIIFMDEPTSGLDARAAAIVMRTVRNTVNTGRTVVCTIHQPSIDIFEAFDELLLMKTGGQLIYAGPLGLHSQNVIKYFQAIPGVPAIKDKQNPATWMLEVTSETMELQLGIDFAEYYTTTTLCQQNKDQVEELSDPAPEAKDLYFPTKFSEHTWGQFKSCLWKQWKSYWRSPDYNIGRFFFSLAAALVVGSIFWQIGNKRDNNEDLLTIIGAMYIAVLFVGINNCSSVQPIIDTERTVLYRERAAGMYSALPYAMAQVAAEVPYVFAQSTCYTLIVYNMMSFQLTAAKFLWFYFVTFFSFLQFTYFGMMTMSVAPNQQAAAIFAGAFYSLYNLFSGFYITRPKIPLWWIWYYWICPVAWSTYGIIVSQYGDVKDTIEVPGMSERPSIKDYIKHEFGYDSDFMGPVAVVLIGYAAFFALMYSFCISKLNFQTR